MTPADLERLFAEAVARAFRNRGDDVLAILERGGDWQAALEALYAEIRAALELELGPVVSEGIIEAARAQAIEANVSVIAERLGNRATRAAESYTYELVKGITDTTRDKLASAVTAFLDDPDTDITALGQRLEWLFGGDRGKMIAITESTRATAQGQRVLVQELRAENPAAEVVEVWQTSEDELVCPVCGPKNGQRITGNDMPPAHPNCRCAVRVVVLSVGGKRV